MGANPRRRLAATATALAIASLLLGAPATAAPAPPRGRIGPGATLVTLREGASQGPTGSSRNEAVIARVRRLVNALPVYRPAPVCPDDLMVPWVLAFYRRGAPAPYAEVSFQLGGCPKATVVEGARVVAPSLGGPHLLAAFDLIRRLIDRPSPTT